MQEVASIAVPGTSMLHQQILQARCELNEHIHDSAYVVLNKENATYTKRKGNIKRMDNIHVGENNKSASSNPLKNLLIMAIL